MRWCLLTVSLLSLLITATADCNNVKEKYVSGNNTNVYEALRFLKNNDRIVSQISNKAAIASWKYQSNLTEPNKEAMLKMQQEIAKLAKETWKNATSFAWKDLKEKNATAYRWFKSLSVLGTAALPDDKFAELSELTADMQDTYAKAKVCRFNSTDSKKCDLSLEPELTEILINSRNEAELKHVWSKWRDVTGKVVKDQFLRYVNLSNEAACLNGFKNNGEMWREAYESDSFEEEVEELWSVIKPFYEQLHAYVRRKLIQRYPRSGIKPDGPIPAHLLESDINTLMHTALDKIAFLPFGYLIDAWRWKVFDGSIKRDELNSKWWELRYFVSHVIQFQFHKALCDAAGYKGPLHKCDIYRNKKAGQLLGDMLSLGKSVHWNKAMSVITQGATHKMNARPLVQYFAPLLKWLKLQNKNETLGWNSSDPMVCP
ncbi:Angiotensin-converting enzyme [Araneus ventricosus]|uniref:Angiotensin-converting enzyme n=2 Tax=Araneus ventricosus TaxID=182803 RepID=A0A4Y2HGE2_ARAVE|nr:Angiotensin-converting enzyme [Araneus ventricosus]